jgi:hypothetical protein
MPTQLVRNAPPNERSGRFPSGLKNFGADVQIIQKSLICAKDILYSNDSIGNRTGALDGLVE